MTLTVAGLKAANSKLWGGPRTDHLGHGAFEAQGGPSSRNTAAPLALAKGRRTDRISCLFQTVQNCASVNVEKRLHCSQQERPEQGQPRPSKVLLQIQSDQLRVDPRSFCTVIHIVLCVHVGVSCFRRIPRSVVIFWNGRPRPIVAVVEFSAFVPRQYVGMQRLSCLRFSSIPQTPYTRPKASSCCEPRSSVSLRACAVEATKRPQRNPFESLAVGHLESAA